LIMTGENGIGPTVATYAGCCKKPLYNGTVVAGSAREAGEREHILVDNA